MVTTDKIVDWLSSNADWLSIFAIILVFSIITIRYYTSKDSIEPEPKWRLLYAFVLGVISILPAISISLTMLTVIDASYAGTIVAPVAEELTKALFVLMLSKSDEFEGPLDGMVYGAMVGTGFAFVENLLYAFDAFTTQGVFAGVFIASFRSLFQIIGHPLYTAITGYGIGAAKVGLARVKLGRLWQAMLLHGIWNGATLVQGYGALPFVLVIILSIIILRYEIGKAVKLDKKANEQGFYGKTPSKKSD